jgi:small subunit ribosomal protein S19
MEIVESNKKIQLYRGKTLEELKSLDVREFSKYVPSRSRRFILRNFQKIENFIRRAKKKNLKNKPMKTHARTIVVVPEMVGMKIQVYNGRVFTPFDVTFDMMGHVIGEFSPTRGRVKHGNAGVGASKGSKSKSKK